MVLDLETTGGSAGRDRITEVAAVRISEGKENGRFQTLVNPGIPIPWFITGITGITDGMVKDKPPIDHILPQLIQFLGTSVVIAHNAPFDGGFLRAAYLRCLNRPFLNQMLCSVKLARKLLPHLPSRSLGPLSEYLGIVNPQAHRAMADVLTTVKVIEKMVPLLRDKGITNEDQVLGIMRS